MTEKPASALDHEITRGAMQLSLGFLVNDLSFTTFMALPTLQQIALAQSFGLTPPMLIKAIEEVGVVVAARNQARALRAVTPGTSGSN